MTGPTRPETSAAPSAALRVLTDHDIPAAAELLARSFEQDPGSVAFVADPGCRVRLNALSSTHTLRAAVPHASVYGAEVDGMLAGVAVWHPPGASTRSLPADLGYARSLGGQLPALLPVAARLASTLMRDRRAATRLALEHRAGVQQASDGPTWHLAVLATDAAHRGRGVARLLIDHVLARCDSDRLAAWLETTNPVNPPIYERFGFETVARIEGGQILPTWWIMRREPHVRST